MKTGRRKFTDPETIQRELLEHHKEKENNGESIRKKESIQVDSGEKLFIGLFA